MSNELRKFKLGNYEKNSICDSNAIAKYEIVRRTEKSIWVKQSNGKIERKGITIYDNAESIYPDGHYSMCRILRPEDRVEEVIEEVKVEAKKEYPELKVVETKTELVEINKDNLERNQTIESVEDRSDENIKRMLITFKNGYKLSIIRGMGTYGSESGLFEIAPMNNSGKFNKSLFDKDDRDDNVLGYCDVKKVELYIYKIGNKIKNIKEL
jgi:hypothetical protein